MYYEVRRVLFSGDVDKCRLGESRADPCALFETSRLRGGVRTVDHLHRFPHSRCCSTLRPKLRGATGPAPVGPTLNMLLQLLARLNHVWCVRQQAAKPQLVF